MRFGEQVLDQERLLAELDQKDRNSGAEAAAAIGRAAIARGLKHPKFYYVVAREEMARSRFEDALTILARGSAENPGDAALLVAQGTCFAGLGEHEFAVQAYETALRYAPQSFVALVGLALALANAGDLAGAEAQYNRVSAAASSAPDASAGLALVAVQRGEAEAAIRLAKLAIERDPSHPLALQAMVDSALLTRDYELAEWAATRLAEIAETPSFDPSIGWLRLGDALHGQGRYGQAFVAYKKGKTQLARRHAARFTGSEQETPTARAERLISEMARISPSRWASPASIAVQPEQAARPIAHGFILGFPRSGTTLLEEILGAHPEVVSLDERPTFAISEDAFMRNPGGLKELARIDVQAAEYQRGAYWSEVDRWAPKRAQSAVIDKLPLRSMSLPIIAKLFPDARVLLATRDPRDTVLSCFRRAFSMNPSTYEFTSLEGAARLYDAVMRLVAVYRSALRLNLRIVRHEELVTNFSDEARSILEFLGLPWADGVSDFVSSSRRRTIRTPSANQIRQGLNTSGFGQWKAYERELAPILPILEPWVAAWGYEQ